jgi:hypothetical protein
VCKVFGIASYNYVADRRNKRVMTGCGYLNYMITVICLIVYRIGFSVYIMTLHICDFVSQTLFVTFILYIISSHTSSTVVVVWVSIVKIMFLEITENLSEVDNKLRYTQQEEASMKRNVMFNIISEIILLTVIKCTSITYNIDRMASEPYYIIVIETTS